ncbi:MAG: hypothetical protein II689_00255, partial [Firmicutes bacterium]|nr:hypothetical protein [Bacillota bacterium]
AEKIAMEVATASDAESAKQAMIDFDAPMVYIPLAYYASFEAFDSDLEFSYTGTYSPRNMRWK